MANKAYKFRIYPNAEQRVLFAKTFGCVRFIYNYFLSKKIELYKSNKQSISYVSCANQLPALKKEEQYQFLKEVDSVSLQQALRHLDVAFKNFFERPAMGFPKFKSKKIHKNSYTTICNKNTITLSDEKLKLPKVGYVRVKQRREIPSDYKLKSATISQTPSGKYYASILFKYENQVSQITPQTFIGLDFSMHELYVDSNGNEPQYPRYYRKSEQKLKREQRKLSLMQKGSNNRDKQRIKVAKLYEKVTNQRKDFLHKQSRQITNIYDCVCIEDLNMKAMSQSLNFGKSVSDNGWGMFTRFLQYKLAEQGKTLVKVDKYFPSSQTCSCCGYKNTETKKLICKRMDLSELWHISR